MGKGDFLRTLATILGLLLSLHAFGAATSCPEDYEDLTVKSPPRAVTVLSPTLKKDQFLLSKQENYDPKAVYIGVANSKLDGAHHYYLISGNQRFDAVPLFRKSNLKTFKGDKVLAPKGTLFQVQFSDDIKQKIEAAMKAREGSRNLSCLHGVCHVLNDAGVELNLPRGRLKARPFLLNLVNGKLSENGQAIPKDAVQMLATSEKELTHFLKQNVIADKEMTNDLIAAAAMQGAMTVTIPATVGFAGYFGYLFYESSGDPVPAPAPSHK